MTPDRTLSRWARALLWAGPLALIAYHVAPMWKEIETWGGTRDWGYFFFLAEVDRKSILEFGQFPLWNPYYCGGAVHLANPQTYFLSAALPLILVFGTPLGIRLMLSLSLVLAWDGVRRLSLAVGLSPLAATIAGAGYAVCGALAQHLGGGHVGWVGFAILPYVLHSFHRALEGQRRHVLYGGLFLAWIFGHFGVYPFPYSCLALGVYGLAVGVAQNRTLKAIGVGAAIVALSLAFSAVRLLPILDFIKDHPRRVWDTDMLRVSELWEIYVVKHTLRDWGHQWVWPEYGNYFGPVGFALVLAGAVFVVLRPDRRVLVPSVVAAFVFVLFQLGNVPYLPWGLLKRLPIFENLRVPSRFTIVVGLFACVLIGVAIDQVLRAASKGAGALWARAAAVAIGLAVATAYLVDASTFNREQWHQTFGTPPPTDPPSPSFHQVGGDPNRMYAYPRANRGSVACFEESPLDISPYLQLGAPAEELPLDPASGTVRRVHWSPNRIELDVDFQRPGRVVVNQNFERHWKVSTGQLVSHLGLLAADVPAGRHRVVFRYLPTPFLVGLAISLVALLAAGGLWYRWRPERS